MYNGADSLNRASYVEIIYEIISTAVKNKQQQQQPMARDNNLSYNLIKMFVLT